MLFESIGSGDSVPSNRFGSLRPLIELDRTILITLKVIYI